jgi:hypothetical protein
MVYNAISPRVEKSGRKGDYTLADIYIFLACLWFFMTALVNGTKISDLGNFATILYHIQQVVWIMVRGFIIVKVIKELQYKDWRIAILVILGFFSILYSDGNWIVNILWFICGAKRVDLEKLIRRLFISQLLAYLIIIALAGLGMITNTSLTRIDGKIRYSFGFYHPNTFAARTFQLMSMHVCIKNKRLNYLDAFIFAIVTFLNYRVTDSMTASFLMLSLVVLSVLVSYASKENRNNYLRQYVRFFLDKLKYTVIIIPFLATFAILNISSFTNNLSGTLASRGTQALLYFQHYGISLFGTKLEINSGVEGWSLVSDLYTLDNSFIYLLLGYGIIFFILFILGEFFLFRKVVKEKNFALLTVLSLYSVYGIMEAIIIQLPVNFTLLYLAYVLWNDGNQKQKSKVRYGRNVL